MYHPGVETSLRYSPLSNFVQRLRNLARRNWLNWKGIQFHVDRVAMDCISGWATNARKPGHRPLVEVRVGGAVVGHTQAGEFREDLLVANIGDGCYGFTIPIIIDGPTNEPVLADIYIDGTRINSRSYVIKPDYDAAFQEFSQHIEKRMDALLALHRERTDREVAEISRHLNL